MHVSAEHEMEVLKSNQDASDCGDQWGAIEELRKELLSATKEISKLHDELRSTKDEVERLRKENEILRGQGQKDESNKDGVDSCSDTVDSQSRSELNDSDKRDEEDSRGACSASQPGLHNAVNDVSNDDSEENNEEECSDESECTELDDCIDDDDYTDNDSCEDDDGTEDEKSVHERNADEDIRLRAARTLIWADSAIKKANTAPRRSSSVGSIEPSGSTVPSTVHFQNEARSYCSAGSASSPGRVSRSPDDAESILSTPESEDGSCRVQKRGPFAGLRQKLEDKMDELIDEIDEIMAPEKEKAPSPEPNYKYCNEAFKKMSEESRPSKPSGSEGEDKATPYCNEAFLKLTAKKKKGRFGLFN